MNNSFDWDKFENQPQISEEISPEKKSNFQWDEFEDFQPEKKESTISTVAKEVGRHAARTGARAIETIAGTPGDIRQLAESGIDFLGKKIAGQKYSSLKEDHPVLNSIYQMTKQILPFGGSPTSEQIREGTKKLTGDYLEPKNRTEEIADSITSDFASLAIPIKGKIPFLRTLGLAVGSNLSSETAKSLGSSEGAQTASKLGSLFLLSSINPKGASKYVSNLYKNAEKLVPENAKVSAKNLGTSIDSLQSNLIKGGTAPSGTKSIQKLNEIRDSIKDGKIGVDDLTAFKRKINELRSGLFQDFNMDKAGMKVARKNLNDVSKLVENSLEEYGKTNPEWFKIYKDANEGYSAIAQSKKVSDYVGDLIKHHPKQSAVAAAAELFFYPKAAPVLAAAYGGLKGVELLSRIKKSPVLRRYYKDVVTSALKEDSVDVLKNLSKFSAQLKRDD